MLQKFHPIFCPGNNNKGYLVFSEFWLTASYSLHKMAPLICSSFTSVLLLGGDVEWKPGPNQLYLNLKWIIEILMSCSLHNRFPCWSMSFLKGSTSIFKDVTENVYKTLQASKVNKWVKANWLSNGKKWVVSVSNIHVFTASTGRPREVASFKKKSHDIFCFRAVFNWVSKVNCVCVGFALPRSVIG